MSTVMTYGNAPSYNDAKTILASAARTATPTAIQINNLCASGIHLVVNVTAKTATPSVIVVISGIDPVTSVTYPILTSKAFDGTTETRVLKIFPAAIGDPDQVANDFLPKNIVISFTHGDADSITYGCFAQFLR